MWWNVLSGAYREMKYSSIPFRLLLAKIVRRPSKAAITVVEKYLPLIGEDKNDPFKLNPLL